MPRPIEPLIYTGAINDEALARHVAEIEELAEHQRQINATMTAVYKSAREAGFAPKLLRRIVAERRLDAETRAEQYAVLDRMRRSLGMLEGTPLGDAAMRDAGGEVVDMPKPSARQALSPPRRRGRPRRGGNGSDQPELPPAA